MGKKDGYISTVLGVKVDGIQLNGVLNKVEEWVADKKRNYIVTPNPEMVVLAQKDESFKRILNGAGISICDGVGLKLADFRLSRLTGGEVMMGLMRLAAKKRWSVMLVGGNRGVAEEAAEILRKRFGHRKIKGIRGLAEVATASQEEKKKLVERINQYRPVLLMVGFGHGKQEKWIAENLGKLKINVAMGVGGVFDQLVRPKLKAPEWIKRLGLEWGYRLVKQPWRVKRQMVLLEYLWLLLVN